LPFLEITLGDIIFDPKVQTYCISPEFKCPSYGHSWACPPEAPYLEEIVSKFTKFYLIYYKLNLNGYIKQQKAKNPEISEEKIKNMVLMGNPSRNKLEKEILKFLEENQGKFNEKLVLWDGFCRICSNKEHKGCTYDSDQPCRYPDKRRYSMEAVGIDVTRTVRDLNLSIEWPPNNHVFRFGLVCFK
jgi:predicted metal-binding protein